MYPRYLDSCVAHSRLSTRDYWTGERVHAVQFSFPKAGGLSPDLPLSTLTPSCLQPASKSTLRALPGPLSVPAPHRDEVGVVGAAGVAGRTGPEEQSWAGKRFASPERSTPQAPFLWRLTLFVWFFRKGPAAASVNTNHGPAPCRSPGGWGPMGPDGKFRPRGARPSPPCSSRAPPGPGGSLR